jgi:hypothetical protein
MKGIPKASVRSLAKIEVLLLVVLFVFPAMSFAESEITINIGPELQSQLLGDNIPSLGTYLPYAARPPLRCIRLNDGDNATSRVIFPADITVNAYVFFADPGTDDERLVCDIANHPNDTSLIDQGKWSPVFTGPVPVNVKFSAGVVLKTAIVLIVGNQTSNYTFVGPVFTNHDPTCCSALVPAFNHWGLILFSLLLVASTLWFARRKKVS